VSRTLRCPACGGPLPPPARTGRPRRFCSDACRFRHARAQARAQDREPWSEADQARNAAAVADWLASLPAGPLADLLP